MAFLVWGEVVATPPSFSSQSCPTDIPNKTSRTPARPHPFLANSRTWTTMPWVAPPLDGLLT